MEPLRQDDPRRLGPYALVGRLDVETREVGPADRRFLGLAPGDGRAALVSTLPLEHADDAAHLRRFRTEALAAQHAAPGGDARTPWLLPVTEVSGPDAVTVWCAAPYRPALPLPAVLERYGPLPARTLLVVGTALGEALAALHAAGTAHAGVTADAVLLTGAGPRLTGYGAARVTAPDGAPRPPHPFLAPEQITGGRPRPLGDLYGLAAVLAYAATGRLGGRTDSDGPALPDGPLGSLLAACLSQDPAARPSAPAFLRTLAACAPAPARAAAPGAGPGATVLDGAATPHAPAPPTAPGAPLTPSAAALLTPGWLPRRVSAALAVQAAAVLAAEADEDAPAAAGTPAPVPTTVDGVPSPGPPSASRPVPAGARGLLAPSRRSLLTAAGAGAAGVAVGGSVAWAVTLEPAPNLSPAAELATRRKSDRRLAGAPPHPKWRHRLAAPAQDFAAFMGKDDIALLADGAATIGLDMHTGQEVWRHKDTHASGHVRPLEDGLVLLAGTDLLAVDPRDGKIHRRSERYRKGGRRPYATVLAAQGTVVWLTVDDRRSSAAGGRTLVAYDIAADRELWTGPLPAGYRTSHLLPDALLVVTAEKDGPQHFAAFAPRSGKKKWTRTYKSVRAGQFTAVADPATLVAVDGAEVRGFALTEKPGKAQWKTTVWNDYAVGHRYAGPPLTRDGTVYVSDSDHGTSRIQARTGKRTWRSDSVPDLRATGRKSTPDLALTPNGQVLVSAGDSEVDAYDTSDGTMLWRFLDLPGSSEKVLVRRKVAVGDASVLVVSGQSAYALPLR